MKNFILRSKILILQLALYLISITMSKAKHPANVVLLTESEQVVHISALVYDVIFSRILKISD